MKLQPITLSLNPEVVNTINQVNKEAEDEARRKKNTYWIIGGVVVFILAWFYFKKRK